jgi:hypothetical protein
MITVVIFVNGSPIFARSAQRVGEGEKSRYEVDTGELLEHRYEDGAVLLAKKMLDTVKLK